MLPNGWSRESPNRWCGRKTPDFCSCWFRRCFVAGPQLTYEAGSVDGDYDTLTNRTNFGNWAKETVIPNIPEEPVVVFDSAPFHYVQADILQSKHTVKAEMISRLRRQKIGFMPLGCNIQQIIQYTLTKEKTYRFKLHGYTVHQQCWTLLLPTDAHNF